MQTFTATLTASSPTLECNVADLRNVVVWFSGTWQAKIEFTGSNDGTTFAPWALNSTTDTSLVTVVTSDTGSSPSGETQMYRGNVAGLTRFKVSGVADGVTPFIGSVTCFVTAV